MPRVVAVEHLTDPMVAAVDWSTTKTGLAQITRRADGSCLATATVLRHEWPSTKKARAKAGLPEKMPLPERRERFVAATKEVLRFTLRAELVVVAAPLTQAPGAGDTRVDLLAGWWAVVGPLVREGVPVASLLDSPMKKAITDDGRADKAKIAAHMSRLYPDVEIESDDVSDALGFAHLGAAALGWSVPTPALARYRLTKWAEWPTDLVGEPFAAAVAA